MTPNNNLSVLPWYSSLAEQNARKWWAYGRVYPLFTLAGYLPSFQLLIPHTGTTVFNYFRIFTKDGQLVGEYTDEVTPHISVLTFESFGYDVVVFDGQSRIFGSMPEGQYYAEMTVSGTYYYSEIFTVVGDVSNYIKIEWWDEEDFVMDAGRIAYDINGTQFRNTLYICSDIAKPEYNFEEEVIERDGYAFPVKRISSKVYKFSFLAPEYLLDVMRFIRMADHVTIIKDNKVYTTDTFLINPDWEGNGDIASVKAEFTTATAAKKITTGYIRALRGDFNDDFNNDFNN